MIVHFADSPDAAVKQYRSLLENGSGDSDTDQVKSRKYGLAVALISSQQPEKAIPILNRLLADDPDRITYVVTLAQAQVDAGKPARAQTGLRRSLSLNPGNFPVMQSLAKADLALEQPDDAARILEHLSQQRPWDATVWQDLAEADGQARDIVGVHRARAEYQFLMGNTQAALLQLRQALHKVSDNAPLKEIIQQRLNQLQRYDREHQDQS
jgi:predicted Zn-dependent protease